MTNNRAPSVASLAAVAVALTFASTPAWAQDVPVPGGDIAGPAEPAPPPVVTPPVDTLAPPSAEPVPDLVLAPTQPSYTPPSPVVQAVPATPETPAAARTAPRQPATTPGIAPRVASPAADAPAPVAAPAQGVAPPARVIAPAVPMQPEASPVVATGSAERSLESDAGLFWGVVGGGALLVLGGGAFAFAARRQRRREAARLAFRDALMPPVAPTERKPVPQPVPVTASVAPVTEPVYAEPARTEPIHAEPVAAELATRASAPVASRWPELEHMVAERPSEANPFVTRRKRLRRANYIMAHGAPRPFATSVPHAAPAAAAAAAPAQPTYQPSRPQTVYDFGKGTVPLRPRWKPASST